MFLRTENNLFLKIFKIVIIRIFDTIYKFVSIFDYFSIIHGSRAKNPENPGCFSKLLTLPKWAKRCFVF